MWDLREAACSVPVLCVLCLVLASAASFILSWSPFLGFFITVGSVLVLALVTRPVDKNGSDSGTPSTSFSKSATPSPVREVPPGPVSRSATMAGLGLSKQHIIHLRNIYQRHHGPGVVR